MTGVALAAGGFVISSAVYLFGMEEYKPLVRPAILTGFLGYFLVVSDFISWAKKQLIAVGPGRGSCVANSPCLI